MRKLLITIATVIAALTMTVTAQAAPRVEYTQLGVPNVNSYWKTWEGFRILISDYTPQGIFLRDWGWTDENGFVRASGEKDLGIPDDYYLVAMGSYYGTEIGTKYRVTLDTGRVIYCVLGDQKADCDTDSNNQYTSRHQDILEFIVNVEKLNYDVKFHGNCNVFMPLNGIITSIERIDFIWEE